MRILTVYEFLRGLNHVQLSAVGTIAVLVLGTMYALVEKACEVLANTWRHAATNDPAEAPVLSEAD